MTILDEIAGYAKYRVEQDRKEISDEMIRKAAETGEKADGEAFYEAISHPGLSFICEIKKASPSKGIIDPVFDYLRITDEYEKAGADALSCLTEPKWFLGSDEIFGNIRRRTGRPMLRKDFAVDAYQLYQAKVLGANAVLLICALLDQNTLAMYLQICSELGLAVLTETHNDEEIRMAVDAGARMIGVNNRDLKDFTVDLNTSAGLRELIPESSLFVAESGIRTAEDAARMKQAGADAVLIGEAMMRAEDKTAFLTELREAAR